ncbi:MAG: hypothetical protein FJW46_02885 [Actinobacteria bacterium]|nr:hypothetical protein [Actinomycetota bacterium]
MALPLSTPITRSRVAFVEKSSRAILKLVPELRPVAGQRASDRIFYGVIGAILVVGLLGILGINILLGSDAVRIKNLKLEAIQLAEEREAARREISRISDPENLARRASALGMVENNNIKFILMRPEVATKAGE